MLRRLPYLILVCSACAHAPGAGPAAVSSTAHAPEQAAPACLSPAASPASALIQQHGTILDAYRLEGGVWLEGAPVLLNEDFDFALAMSMEGGLGAGLAAAKRKENNAQKAAALAAIVAPADLQQRLDALRCCGMHVYFQLWGADSALLRTVVDVPGNRAASRVLESPARPLRGDASWAAAGQLVADAQASIATLECEHARSP